MKKILTIIIMLWFGIPFGLYAQHAADINKGEIEIEDNVYDNDVFKVKIHGPKGWQVRQRQDFYFRRSVGQERAVTGVYFQVDYFSESPRGTKNSPHFILFKGLKEDRYKDPGLSTVEVVDGVLNELKNIRGLKIIEKPVNVNQRGREWIRFVFELGDKRQENYYLIDHGQGVLYIFSAGAYRRTVRSYLDSAFESIEFRD